MNSEKIRCLRTSIRMLFDLSNYITSSEPWEIGCKCKNEVVANFVFQMLTGCLDSLQELVHVSIEHTEEEWVVKVKSVMTSPPLTQNTEESDKQVSA